MKNDIRLCIVFACLVTVPLAANAEPTYSVFAGLNYSQLETAVPDGDIRLSLPENQTSLRARVGGQVSWHWGGVEIGWADLGSVRGTVQQGIVCIGGCPPGQAPSIHEERQKGSVAWAAFTPIMYRRTNWIVAGKLGLARVRIERDVVSGGTFGSTRESELLIGAGAEYAVTERLRLRFDVERLGSVATSSGISIAHHF